MRITVLAGGFGGSRFISGVRDAITADDELSVIANTADDIWLFGLRISPDLDTIMYTLGGGIDPER
ncbi:MAG TPA: 2-phospho-L-lactate transferase CofD family protein, partial [Acidimicrobiia bacterium]|nr:2-phospho-L-lactate transferase CofD family protein [Acidimicrobiia bacterium]